MLIKSSFPWYTTLTVKDAIFSLVGRLLSLCYIAVPLTWLLVFDAPLRENTLFSIAMALVLTAFLCVGSYLTNRTLHRLFSAMYPSLHGVKKKIAYFITLILPILELVFIFKNDADTEELVPAFLQPNGDGKLSLLHSYIFFEEGIPEPNASEIAKFIRERYFASTSNQEGEYAISIATNQYEFLCLLQGCRIYMFALVDPKITFSTLPDGWRFEASPDDMAAIIYEESIDTLDLNGNKYLAKIIICAIDELLGRSDNE